MLANFKSGYPDQNDSSHGELLRDIEEISKALYFENKTHVDSLVSFSKFGTKLPKRPNFVNFGRKSKHGFGKNNEGLKEEQKNTSIWGWKPFKALSHIRQRKFNCYFFCHVHCIENLKSDFNDVSMIVVWKRKDNVLRTPPSRVSNGMVEFEETLMSKCTVYSARNGSGEFVKYDPKHFLLYALIVGSEGVEIGKHWVDLTRLLPITLDELEQDKCSGKWSTSFKLSGKAEGATLHVSFGFLITKDCLIESGSNVKPPLGQSSLNRISSSDSSSIRGNTVLRRVGSVSSSLTDAKNGLDSYGLDSYDFLNSISYLYGKLEEGDVDSPMKIDMVVNNLESFHLVPHDSLKDDSGAKNDDVEFRVVEKGIESEFPLEEEKKFNEASFENLEVSCIEVIDVAEIFKDDDLCLDEEINMDTQYEALVNNYSAGDAKESNLEQDFDLHKMSSQQYVDSGMSEEEIKVKPKGSNLVKSLSLDDIAKSVADDFINMLEDIHTPSPRNSNADLESPRERLLRQFEEDLITSGCLLLDYDVENDDMSMSKHEYETPCVSSFDHIGESIDLSPIIDFEGFASNGNEYELPKTKLKAKSLERLETQTLMQKWGLNEDDFLNSPYYSKGGFGSPIPIPIPQEESVGIPPLGEGLGSLLHLKGGGCLRSMCPLIFRRAKNCGPLIVQTSKTIVLPVGLGSDILDIFQCLASIGSDRLSKKMYNLMPLEDLSGKIMQELAWEASNGNGELERQTSSHQDSDIKIQFEEHPCFQDHKYPSSSSTGSDLGSFYLSTKDIPLLALDSIEPLIIEGLKIQSGMPDHDAPSNIMTKSTSELGSSQHRIDYSNDPSDYIDGLLDLSISMEEWLRVDSIMSGDNKEVSENTLKVRERNLTLALMLQLRDPLRNYEPVGGPMLSLIQVKRLIRPLTCVLEDGKEGEDMNMISRFRLEEVHVGGLNLEADNNLEVWSSKGQREAGTRWLLASGLTKSSKARFSKSRSIMKIPTQVLGRPLTRSFIWSISRPVYGVGVDPFTRNPDVMFP